MTHVVKQHAYLDTAQAGTGADVNDAAPDLASATTYADSVLSKQVFMICPAYSQDVHLDGYVLIGYGQHHTAFTGASGRNSYGTLYVDLTLIGQFGGTSPTSTMHAEDCHLSGVRAQVHARRCRITGTFVPVDHCILEDCNFAPDEGGVTAAVVVDLTNCTSFVMTRCTGRVEFINRNSATGTYHVYGGGGTIALKSSLVQWATFVVEGDWRIVERANGASAPLTDYSVGRSQDTLQGQAHANYAGSNRASFVVSGAQTISDTSIEVTTTVQGSIGETLMVNLTGEVMLITALSGTTYTVTRGAFGSIAQPIPNGARMDLIYQRSSVAAAIDVLIAVLPSLLATVISGVTILDGKVNAVQDLIRGVADSQAHYRAATTATVTDVATSVPVDTDPTAPVIVGSRVQNLRTGEVMVVTGTTTSTLVVTRAQAGTTAAAMLSGDRIIEFNLAEESLQTVLGELANISSDLIDTYLNTQTLLTLPVQIFRVDAHVRALMAEASVTTTTVVGFHDNVTTTLALASVSGIAAGDWLSALGSGGDESELILVTAVNTGPVTVTVVRGQLGTVADILNGHEVVVLRRKEIIRHVLNLFRNNAETVVGGGGERTVTIYEEDGVTVKNVVEISADGLDRTRIT